MGLCDEDSDSKKPEPILMRDPKKRGKPFYIYRINSCDGAEGEDMLEKS